MRTATRARLPEAIRGVVLLCGAVLLLDTSFYAVLSPLLAGYVDRAGLDETAVGLLVAAYPLGMVAGAFPAGMLCSRLGARPTMQAGALAAAVTCALFATVSTGPQLIGFRFLQGVGGVLAWTGAMVWVSTIAPADRRGELIGRVLGLAVIGGILGPVFGVVGTVVGPTALFVGLGLLLASLAAIAQRFPAPQRVASPGWLHALRLLRDHRLRLGFWLLALGGIGFGVINATAPLTLARLGVTAAGTGAIFLLMAASASISSPRVGRRTDRHGRPVIAILALAIVSVSMVVTGLAAQLLVLVPLLVVAATALEALYIPGNSLMVDGTAEAHGSRGELLSLANLVWALGMSLASVLAGVSVANGSAALPYIVVALCALATIPEFVLMARRARA